MNRIRKMIKFKFEFILNDWPNISKQTSNEKTDRQMAVPAQ